MAETLSDPPVRSSPVTGTVLPVGRPFWIVDGRAYDFTEWMRQHPGGATWFGPRPRGWGRSILLRIIRTVRGWIWFCGGMEGSRRFIGIRRCRFIGLRGVDF